MILHLRIGAGTFKKRVAKLIPIVIFKIEFFFLVIARIKIYPQTRSHKRFVPLESDIDFSLN